MGLNKNKPQIVSKADGAKSIDWKHIPPCTQVSGLEGSLQVEANTIKSSNRREDGRTDTYAPPQPPTIVIYDAPSDILCWRSC